jgi:biopolymer transport protein ExbD
MSEMNSEKAEPNLTPLLDMVFQLITFFMLVINFKGASLDLSLKLPVLGSARPLERTGKIEAVILNVDAEGNVKANGDSVVIEQHMEREARLLKAQLKLDGKENVAELPAVVVIRADRAATFKVVNHVITVCQNHGYRQFSLSAMTREEGSK